MRRLEHYALSGLLVLASALAWCEDPRPRLEEIFRPPTLLGDRPEAAAVSADGSRVLYRRIDRGGAEATTALWLARTDGSESRPWLDDAGGVRTWWTPRGAELLVARDGWIEAHDIGAGSPARPLLEVGAIANGPEFLPDGRRFLVSERESGRIWLVDIDTGERRELVSSVAGASGWFALAEDASTVVFVAQPSAVGADPPEAEEGRGKEPPPRVWTVGLEAPTLPVETAVASEGRLLVSADARFLARVRTESSVDRDLIIADYLTERVTTRGVRDSLAGDPAPKVTVAVVDLRSGVERAVAFGGRSRFHLRSVAWASHGARLLVDRVSEDWHVREVLVVEPESGDSRQLWSERDEAWIGGPFTFAAWSPDGRSVLLTSEVSGHNHLWSVTADGTSRRAVTSGAHEVQWVRPTRDGKGCWLLSNEGDPADRALWRVDLETGAKRRLTPPSGWAGRPAVSADDRWAVLSREELGVPGDLWAVRSDGAASTRLTDTVPRALRDLELPPPEIVSYRNRDDGREVRAFLYRPIPFDPDTRYPAVVFVHGAGYLQNVRRSMTAYDVNYLFHQRLRRMGFAVLDPDYRHSAGYGRDFRAEVHGWMGGKDLDDVVAGVAWLGELGWVDTTRVGIYGGSYGGFLTLMALFTQPDVFACGAALRSVTDWRTYHAGYTHPRLGSPTENPQNYRRSSPIDHAEGLTKPLLILHGLRDSNVFAQDSIRLIEKLIGLGKDFDAMLYPSQDHAFTDPASWIDEYHRIERLFVRCLRPESASRRL